MSHADWMAIAALHVECTEPATLTAEADLGSATLCSVPRGAVLRCVGHAVLDCGLRRRVVYGEHTGWISAERFMISSPLVFGREEDDEFFVQACAMSGVQVARRIDEDDMRIDGLLPPCLRGDAETVDEEVAAADGTAARLNWDKSICKQQPSAGACGACNLWPKPPLPPLSRSFAVLLLETRVEGMWMDRDCSAQKLK